MVTILGDGRPVETAGVGRESALGLLDAVTERPARVRAFAQIGGGALRESPALTRLTPLHMRANAVHAEQGVACNAAHSVSARLARWLLMTQDRVGGRYFSLTQDYLAVMTGVQRSTVSVAASALKQRGLISYSRGSMAIVDRTALEHEACECYAIFGQQFTDLRGASGG